MELKLNAGKSQRFKLPSLEQKSLCFDNLAVECQFYPFLEQFFANKLKKIAQFIAADSDIMVYYVSLNGFDTHVNQIVRQNKLLGELSDGIAAFMKDLKSSGKSEDVLMMTFSEFGRRVKQNASGGTDHGTANNIMLFSGDLKKQGVFNEVPNLESLAEGDLQYSLDFRSVYATILRKWLHADDQIILGRTFDMLNFI